MFQVRIRNHKAELKESGLQVIMPNLKKPFLYQFEMEGRPCFQLFPELCRVYFNTSFFFLLQSLSHSPLFKTFQILGLLWK